MDTALAVRYTAKDGQEIELTADTVNRYIISGNAKASDAEIMGFLQVCKARGLNPLARDAYLVKYGEKSPASVIVSKDYYTRTATEQPSYDGFDAGVVVCRPDGSLDYRSGALIGNGEYLVGGWANIYDKNRSHPTKSVVSISEYNTGKSLWASKPATMIRKVALVQALREAYPAAFQGLYDESEMPEMPKQAPITVEPIEAPRVVAQASVNPRKKELWELTKIAAQLRGMKPEDLIKEFYEKGNPQRDYELMDEPSWNTYKKAIENLIITLRSVNNAVPVTTAPQYMEAPEYEAPYDDVVYGEVVNG